MSTFPYDGRFPVHRELPEKGTPRREILEALRTMATEEDASWESAHDRSTAMSRLAPPPSTSSRTGTDAASSIMTSVPRLSMGNTPRRRMPTSR